MSWPRQPNFCYSDTMSLARSKFFHGLLTTIQKSELIDSAVEQFSKFDNSLTPNMRAIRLTATIADQLLSMGAPASDAVRQALDITRTYCTRKVHVDVSYTLLTLSQDRGNDREPLTVIQTIQPRGENYRVVQDLYELSADITAHKLTLDKAEHKLDAILARKKPYPLLLRNVAAGGLSLGWTLLYTNTPLILALTFCVGFSVNWLLYVLTKRGVPSFYLQVFVSLFVTMLAAFISWLADVRDVHFLSKIDPTTIVVSGIMLLVAGMTIVGALQDAIDQYYVTASARLLQALMATIGIVTGVVVGLYIATRLGVHFTTTSNMMVPRSIVWQALGAGIIAASYAFGNHARTLGTILAGSVGFIVIYTDTWLVLHGIGNFAATAVSALLVGLIATLIANIWRIPNIITINAGILPLVPGLMFYSGLMYTIQSAPLSNQFNVGLTLLLQSILTAAAVAIGATFGNLIGKPAQRRLTYLENRLPIPKLGKK